MFLLPCRERLELQFPFSTPLHWHRFDTNTHKKSSRIIWKQFVAQYVCLSFISFFSMKVLLSPKGCRCGGNPNPSVRWGYPFYTSWEIAWLKSFRWHQLNISLSFPLCVRACVCRDPLHREVTLPLLLMTEVICSQEFQRYNYPHLLSLWSTSNGELLISHLSLSVCVCAHTRLRAGVEGECMAWL